MRGILAAAITLTLSMYAIRLVRSRSPEDEPNLDSHSAVQVLWTSPPGSPLHNVKAVAAGGMYSLALLARLGGHLFSVFPWAHLLFSERALIRWRSDFKTDGATRFSEVAGGLNQMTMSPLRMSWMECVPIRKLHRLHNYLTREFTTSIVGCELQHA